MNPATFNAIPHATSKTPAIHRIGPWTKTVGKKYSITTDTNNGITNSSGGAIGTPGRSSLASDPDGIAGKLPVPTSKSISVKSEGRLRFRKRPSYFDGDKPNSV